MYIATYKLAHEALNRRKRARDFLSQSCGVLEVCPNAPLGTAHTWQRQLNEVLAACDAQARYI